MIETKTMLPPVRKSIEVKADTAKAFDVFVRGLETWWPLKTHTLAREANGEIGVSATIEPFVGGRVYETLNTGEERDWGVVCAYEEGRRVAFSWNMGRPAEQATEVEVTFTVLAGGGARIDLEHRLWERMGVDAERMREGYNNGWEKVFVAGFGGAM